MTEYNVPLIQHLYQIYEQKDTGSLTISSSQKELHISFWNGDIIAVHREQGMESFTNYLTRNGLISQHQIQILQQQEAQGKTIAEALVDLGLIAAVKLGPYQERFQKYLLSNALSWKQLDSDFISSVSSIQFDKSLGFDLSTPKLLWQLITDVVAPNTILPLLVDRKKGRFCFFEHSKEKIQEFQLPVSFTKIMSWGGQKKWLQDITNDIIDTTGSLFQMLWLFEVLGFIIRENNMSSTTSRDMSFVDVGGIVSETDTKDEVIGTEMEDLVPKSNGNTKTKNPIVSMIEQEHARLMGKDYYGFLHLPQQATLAEIEEKCRRYYRNFQTFKNKNNAKDPLLLQKIEDLEQGLDTVSFYLRDRGRRREYDKKLLFGEAEIVTSGQLNIALIPKLIRKKEYQTALQELNKHEVSDLVLAYRGWVKFQLGMSGAEADILESLRLNDKNKEGLELILRIRLQQKRYSEAKIFVDRLLSVEPDMKWAKEVKLRLGRVDN